MIGRRQAIQALAASAVAARAQLAAKPNILFVLSDDHSYPYLGLYGSDWISTPNLDRFGREGMVFESYGRNRACGRSLPRTESISL